MAAIPVQSICVLSPLLPHSSRLSSIYVPLLASPQTYRFSGMSLEENAGIKISIEAPEPADDLLVSYMSGGDQNHVLTYSYRSGFAGGYSSTIPHSQVMSSSPGYPSSLSLLYGSYRNVQPEIPSPASTSIDSPIGANSDFAFSPLFENPSLDGNTTQYTDPTAFQVQTQVDNELSQEMVESMLLQETFKQPIPESPAQQPHGFNEQPQLEPLNIDFLSGDQPASEYSSYPYPIVTLGNDPFLNTYQAGSYVHTGIPAYLSTEPVSAIDPGLLGVPSTLHQRHSYSEGVDPGSSRRVPSGVDDLRRAAHEARSAPTTPDYPQRRIDDSAVDDEWDDEPQSAASTSSHHDRIVKQTIVSDTMRQASEARRTTAATFHCEVNNCGASFTRNSSLKRHMNSHTRKNEYPCPTCGRVFVNSSDCRRHQQTKHDTPKTKASCSRPRRLTIKKE